MRVIMWDHNAEPDLEKIGQAVSELTDGKVRFYRPDAELDFYALIVTDTHLSEEEQHLIMYNWGNGELA